MIGSFLFASWDFESNRRVVFGKTVSFYVYPIYNGWVDLGSWSVVEGSVEFVDSMMLISGGSSGFEVKFVSNVFSIKTKALSILRIIGYTFPGYDVYLRIRYNLTSGNYSIIGESDVIRLPGSMFDWRNVFDIQYPIDVLKPGEWVAEITLIGSPNSKIYIRNIYLNNNGGSFEFLLKGVYVKGFWMPEFSTIYFFVLFRPFGGYYIKSFFIRVYVPREKSDIIDSVSIFVTSRRIIPFGDAWVSCWSYKPPENEEEIGLVDKSYQVVGDDIDVGEGRMFNLRFRDLGYLWDKLSPSVRWLVLHIHPWRNISANLPYWSPFMIGPWSFNIGFEVSKLVDRIFYNYAGLTHDYGMNVTILSKAPEL